MYVCMRWTQIKRGRKGEGEGGREVGRERERERERMYMFTCICVCVRNKYGLLAQYSTLSMFLMMLTIDFSHSRSPIPPFLPPLSSRESLSQLMKTRSAELDVKLLLFAIQKTTSFEKLLAQRFINSDYMEAVSHCLYQTTISLEIFVLKNIFLVDGS